MSRGYIYRITNLVNGKVYIGSTVQPREREIAHFSDLRIGKHRNTHLLNSYRKYGKENFRFEVILEVIGSEQRMLIFESLAMKLYRSLDRQYGYNIIDPMDAPNSCPTIRRVIQYDLDGNVVAEYPSVKQASQATGSSPGNIVATCRGRVSYLGGSIWSYENPSLGEIEEKSRIAREKSPKYYQYSLAGDLIAEYESPLDAEKATGIAREKIYCFIGSQVGGGGFYWSKRPVTKEVILAHKNKPRRGEKPVVQFSNDGMILRVFRSIKEASRVTGVYVNGIRRCAKGELTTSGGYKWEYKHVAETGL